MSQNSILELLSVTSNAVKALDKSRSSGSGDGNDNAENQPPVNVQDAHENSRSSADSGVGKTATYSNQARSRKENVGYESDDSTTASDVLIRSTLVDKNPTNLPASLNSSISSQGSQSKELDNFNVADARKVKMSKKHLREIVSPQDALPQPRDTYGNSESNLNNNNQKNMYKPENGKVIHGSFPQRGVPHVQKKDGNEKTADNSKYEADQKKTVSQGVESSSVVFTVERHEKGLESNKLPTSERETTDKSNPAQHVSHFPYKVSRQGGSTKDQVLVEPVDHAEHWDEQSVSSSQPEIVTVEERIVNVSSQALMLSDYEDSASQEGAVDAVSAANQPKKPQSFPNPRPKGAGLRQGALMQGHAVPKGGKTDEVHISRFSLTEKQRELREALSQRANPSKPVRRVVQPKMVPSSASQAELNTNNNMDTGSNGGTGGTGAGNVESITAAVAASAAVAATQPFLKMQQDLENKMQSLLTEMDRVQKQMGGGGAVGESSGGGGQPPQDNSANPRLEQLEFQMKELTERRLQHLETLQSQQLQMQAHMLSISRDMSNPRQQQQQRQQQYHPTYFPTTSSTTLGHGPPSSKPHYNRALIERELMRGRLLQRAGDEDKGWGGYATNARSLETVGGEGESALDTPNPRSKPPRPAQFDGAKGGLLQEILAAEPSPQLNTTFNLAHEHDGPPPTRARRGSETIKAITDTGVVNKDHKTIPKQNTKSTR